MRKPSTYVIMNKTEVRSTIDDDGRVVYALNDIGACLGYKAPRKWSERVEIHKEKCYIKWRGKKRRGASRMWCTGKSELLALCDEYELAEDFRQFCNSLEDSKPLPAPEVQNVRRSISGTSANAMDAASITKALDAMIYSCLELKLELEKSLR